MARESDAEKRQVTVVLSDLAFRSLLQGESEAQAPLRVESALRCYLGDKGTSRAAWPYPGFLRGSESQADVEVELDLESGLWRAFEEEAAAQSVSVEQLAEHAAFYFAAELDAGRLTQRILEDFLGEGDEGN